MSTSTTTTATTTMNASFGTFAHKEKWVGLSTLSLKQGSKTQINSRDAISRRNGTLPADLGKNGSAGFSSFTNYKFYHSRCVKHYQFFFY
jgi:hypothetical protein